MLLLLLLLLLLPPDGVVVEVSLEGLLVLGVEEAGPELEQPARMEHTIAADKRSAANFLLIKIPP